MNHDKLKDYLVKEKERCEPKTEAAVDRRDLLATQYWIGREYALIDIAKHFKINLFEQGSRDDNNRG